MASPYTQDITQSEVYKKLTGKKKQKPIDEFLGGLAELKTLGQSNIADNIKELQDSNTFEMQSAKNQLRNLNNISKIQDTIESNYGGNVDMWAMDYAKNDFENSVFGAFPMDEITSKKIELQPDEAYGDVLKTRAKNIAERYNNIVNSLDKEGISYRDLEKGDTFIDKEYQNIYNELTRKNSFNVIKGIGSLFKGQGFNYTSADDLKSQFKENINKSKISMLETINDEFKALYALSPKLAGEYKEAVKNADVRREIVHKETDLKKGTRINAKGEQEEYTYFEKLMVYTDRNGERQTKKERIEFDGEVVPQKGQINKHMLNLTLYTEEGKTSYRALMEEGFTPEAANEQIPEEQRLSMDSIRLTEYIAQNFEKLSEARMNDYYTTDISGRVIEINPGVKVPSLREYAAELLNISDMDVNPQNKVDGAIIVNSSLNEATKTHLQTDEGQQDLTEIKNIILPANIEDKIIKDYQDGNLDINLKANGHYFGETNDTTLTSPEDLAKFGLTGPVKVGIDLNTMLPVFVPLNTKGEEVVVIPDEEKTDFQLAMEKGAGTMTERKQTQTDKRKLISDFKQAINLIGTGTLAERAVDYFGRTQTEKEERKNREPLWNTIKEKYGLDRRDLIGLKGEVFADLNPEKAQEITNLILNYK
jgi:hypothetical protein